MKNKSNNAHNTNEKENVNKNQKKENGKGEKKEACQVPVVLKIPMHCDSNAGKIIQCICNHESLSLTNLSIWPLGVVLGREGDEARWGWSATPKW